MWLQLLLHITICRMYGLQLSEHFIFLTLSCAVHKILNLTAFYLFFYVVVVVWVLWTLSSNHIFHGNSRKFNGFSYKQAFNPLQLLWVYVARWRWIFILLFVCRVSPISLIQENIYVQPCSWHPCPRLSGHKCMAIFVYCLFYSIDICVIYHFMPILFVNCKH